VNRALKVAFDRSDKGFFRDHPDRKAHIRLPYGGESEGEFWSLGEHQRSRRRIVLWRVPKDNPWYNKLRETLGEPLLKIPFLAFADETIEDTDEMLLPIIDTIMREAKG
jgi:hypothetical protein